MSLLTLQNLGLFCRVLSTIYRTFICWAVAYISIEDTIRTTHPDIKVFLTSGRWTSAEELLLLHWQNASSVFSLELVRWNKGSMVESRVCLAVYWWTIHGLLLLNFLLSVLFRVCKMSKQTEQTAFSVLSDFLSRQKNCCRTKIFARL